MPPMEKKRSRVCVTGGAGYIGSWLIKKLLDRGHYVHTTLRNLGDHSKTSLIKSLPGAETRLSLFEADIYNPEQFDPAIQGCEFVFLVATPLQHNPQISKYRDTTEAALASIRSIMQSCEKSGTVKRVIYTGSVTAASPLKEDGTGYKECIDESIWTPLHLQYAHCEDNEKYKDTSEAALASIRTIMQLCENSGTVRRVIYTGSVTAASPLKEDGSGYKECIDESIWTPLHLQYAHCEDHEKGYTLSKTLSEKEILEYNCIQEGRKFEVVSLVCGLVGGDTLLSYAPTSVQVIVSPLTGVKLCHRQLKFLEALLGSIPLIHIEDVCEAHVFCIEKPSMSGRFICTNRNLTLKEFVDHYELKYPEHGVIKEVEGIKMIKCCSTKLVDMGFKYVYDAKQILDDSVECAKRLGSLKEAISS